MSTFQKPPQTAFLGKCFAPGSLGPNEADILRDSRVGANESRVDYDSARSLQDGASYSSYGQGSYVTPAPMVPSPMADQASQISDCVPYMGNPDYASSYEGGRSPVVGGEPRQLPEVISYSPQRGYEGTRVSVRVQSPYDLHTSSYTTLYLAFGSKKCECVPHFLGFQGSTFQYALSVDSPAFMATGSPSPTVCLQVVMDGQNECPSTTLQVGYYSYDHSPHPSPSSDSRKRRVSSMEDTGPRPTKRLTAQPVQPREQSVGYPTASYSPYLQSLPAANGFVNPYQAGSPRIVSSASQSSIRAPSPLTPSWSPSFVSVAPDSRAHGYMANHSFRQTKPSSPGQGKNPTLIRTSTLQQSGGIAPPQSFNPYAMYPSKAVLKLNGDLNSMTEKWSKEELETKRRLVQFTRMQSGSTIHADFKPVSPEDRTPNSICISCIYWDGKDECFVTSVDTIYLLESLVGVRFTVEEKNRIRRNLEGFRPLTVSKAKADSEDFFKTIMGFPAPKPRNIEKDVKVFPWKILSHALKKIIGKYVSGPYT